MPKNNFQYKWDMWLITSFYNTPDKPMWILTKEFMAKNKINDFQEFDNFITKRRTKFGHHSRSTVAVFLGVYLPKLANVLWESGIEDVFDIAEKLKNSPMDTRNHGVTKNDGELKKSHKLYKLANDLKRERWEFIEKSNRSNWMATKQRGK